MKQQNKPGTRKERLREEAQAKRNSVPFKGSCSNCFAKGIMVVRFKSSQICLNKCLPGALAKVSAMTGAPAAPPIRVE
jgi:hypothetical protein